MDHISHFTVALEHAIQSSQQLQAVLLDETRAIQTRDTDFLLRVVADKQRLVAELEAQTAIQRRCLEQQDQAFTPDGVARFFATLDGGHQLSARWAALRESIACCEQLNRTNAALIERDRKRVDTGLRILQGDDGVSSTYDPRGRTSRGRLPSRAISQA